jgi:hypothetical protein
VSTLRTDSPFKQRPEIAGSHRWEGIFLARGPGIRAGVSLPELSIVDVAPLLLHSLDVPVPEGLCGQLPVAVFEPTELERRPPRMAERCAQPAPAAPVPVLPPDLAAEELVLKRLQALGYVE